MWQVCMAYGGSGKYVLGGCSMGAAAAVWAALLSPRSVRGLVLYLVPTMWAGRQARRGALEAKAQQLRGKDPDGADLVLGASTGTETAQTEGQAVDFRPSRPSNEARRKRTSLPGRS